MEFRDTESGLVTTATLFGDDASLVGVIFLFLEVDGSWVLGVIGDTRSISPVGEPADEGVVGDAILIARRAQENLGEDEDW